MSNYLVHSAKGTTWTKENAKYVKVIRGINGKKRYIYNYDNHEFIGKDSKGEGKIKFDLYSRNKLDSVGPYGDTKQFIDWFSSPNGYAVMSTDARKYKYKHEDELAKRNAKTAMNAAKARREKIENMPSSKLLSLQAKGQEFIKRLFG